jgi:pilus assembly protein CpaE
MKLKPGFSFIDIISQGAALDADVWRGVVQSYSGIDVLLSPQNPVEGAQEMGDTRPILDFSRRLYDNVVIDLGNAYGEWALSAVRASDQVFLVTTNELPALQAAQRVMSYYENHGIARQGIHLIINRFNRDVGLTKEMIETALQTEIYQIVASDYEGVQRALLDGKPIQVSTSIGKQIQQIAERILGVDLEKQKKKTEKSNSGGGLSGLFGLFSRST